MTAGNSQNSEMEGESPQPGETQADFIQKELNFDIDPEDPVTKTALNDHPVDDWVDIFGNGQLKKKVIKAGQKGSLTNRGEMCTLNIVGKLSDGTVVEEHNNLTIQLGDFEVIQGLDLAITLMDVGEVAEIEVNPRFAYGQLGNKPTIPPSATITYTVELKASEFAPEIETLSINQRKVIGNAKRLRGNWWFTRDEPTLAIQCYRRALEFLTPEDDNPTANREVEESPSDAELQALLEDRMKVYNNLVAAQMKTLAFDAALKSVESVLTCQPQNVKALYRKGKILHHKGEHARAYATLLQAAKLEPESKAIQAELAVLKRKNAKDAQHEKNLYRKMLGTHKNSTAAQKAGKKNGCDNKSATKKIAWSLVGGMTVVVLGVLVYKFAS